MADDFAPRHPDEPREGYYKLRAWRAGPWMPARIYRPEAIEPGTNHRLDRWPALVAEIDGQIVDDVFRVSEWGREIDETEFDFITVVTWPEYKEEYYAKRTSHRTIYRDC